MILNIQYDKNTIVLYDDVKEFILKVKIKWHTFRQECCRGGWVQDSDSQCRSEVRTQITFQNSSCACAAGLRLQILINAAP